MKTNPLYHMQNKLIVANWKSNFTKNEAKNWLEEVSKINLPNESEIVILPPFTLLDYVSNFVKTQNLSFKIGAQNLSMFDRGPHTGEISADQIKEFAEFSLVGHSERRKLGETEDIVKVKTETALSGMLTPIVCISNFDQARGFEFDQKIIFAWEPENAISTNSQDAKAEDLDSVKMFANKFTATFQNILIYGGSVNSQNVKDYLSVPGISGVLVGGQSLDPASFGEIINNAV